MGYSVNEYLNAGRGPEWFAPANGTIAPAGSMTKAGTVIEQTITFNNPVPEPASQSARKLRHVALEVAG